MNFDPKPVRLEGRHVRLEPLTLDHAEGLFATSGDPSLWTYALVPQFAGVSDTQKWIEDALLAQRNGTDVPFATVRRRDGRVVGTTRFLDIRRPHRALEIGWTWLAPEAQRTPLNTEAKLLLLRHAFEALGAVRVQLKSDERNQRSREAMLRIGAVFEGILRNYQTRPYDGYVRNTAMYAITGAEWPAVKVRLEAKLKG